MNTELLDAAFQLVSHTLNAADKIPPADLQSQFPDEDPLAIQDAMARAQHLEKVAEELADLGRSPVNDIPATVLNEQTLSERCPGFSSETYFWAINDGFTLTR